jgi:ribosomal-protein-alanine N-acetyltransferase
MIELRRYGGEPELVDPAKTGEFAAEMASLAEHPQVEPWCSYVAWDNSTPVGFGGFKGPPEPDGVVEIGYLTFPAATGRGVATDVARGLLLIARRDGASSVIAHTLPEANASTRVLEKAGFERNGWGEDSDVGAVWRWRANTQAS